MLMCKQMVLTVLVVALTFRAETKFQRRVILLGASAHGAFVLGDSGTGARLTHLCLKLLSSVDFMRCVAV